MHNRTAIRFVLTMLCLLLLTPHAVGETREGVIWLEGMEETIEETLFESADGFSFWYASDMLKADFGSKDDAEGVIVSNPYSSDYMLLSVISEAEASQYADDLGEDIVEQSAASRVQTEVYCELEDGTYSFLTLITENGRYLRAAGTYSEEAAEGTARYFQLVLDSVAFTTPVSVCDAETSHTGDFLAGLSQAWDGLLGMASDAGQAVSDWADKSGVTEWMEGASRDISAWANTASKDISDWFQSSGITEWAEGASADLNAFIEENGPEVEAWLNQAGDDIRSAWDTLVNADQHTDAEVQNAYETVVEALEP